MTLSDFLSSVTNANTVVTIEEQGDEKNTELVKIYAPGYQQLLANLLSREVESVTIVDSGRVTVVLKASA